MASHIAMQKVAQAWSDPTTSHIVMIPELATAFANTLDKYIEAIQWMSGSSDFSEDGQAHGGWVRIRTELLS